MNIIRSKFDTALSKLKQNKAPEINYIPEELFQNSKKCFIRSHSRHTREERSSR